MARNFLILLYFFLLAPRGYAQVYLLGPDQTVFGVIREHIIADDSETLVDLALQYDLGYNEITAANPDLDPWYPRKGNRVVIPTCWVLPAIDDGRGAGQTDCYVVQTGSFSTQEHAMQQYAAVAEEISGAGSNQLRVEKIGAYFGVRLGRFAEREAADRLLGEVRKKFPDADLLKVFFKPEGIIHPRGLEPDAVIARKPVKPCIVVNLAEYRLYRIEPAPSGVTGTSVRTYPIGIGREGYETTPGRYRLTEKLKKPTWVIPLAARIDYPEFPKGFILPGPDNPLGDFALRLSRPDYLIHGTHKPLGVGRRVSRGCIRMYEDDIEQLFGASHMGEEVIITYQPVKIGRRGATVYAEAHHGYLAEEGNPQQQAATMLAKFGLGREIDVDSLARLIAEGRGVPQALPGPTEVEKVQAGGGREGLISSPPPAPPEP